MGKRKRFGNPARAAAAERAITERKAERAAEREAFLADPIEVHLSGYRDTAAAAEEAFGETWRELAWGTMLYGCAGPKGQHFTGHREPLGCGFTHRVWLGLGVEGPAQLREGGTFIPAPMFCGGCPSCGGRLCHTDWNRDEAFEPRPFPEEVARFFVPAERDWRRLADYGGADYLDPSGATR